MLMKMKADLYLNTVFDIDPAAMKAAGIKGFLFDIDNTLEPYHTGKPGDKTLAFFQRLSEQGFKIGIISNAKMPRALAFCENVTPYWVANAGKPLKKGYKQLASMMELKPNEIAAVGDQLFTDIWGGNRFGCFTIYVKPIVDSEPAFVSFKRKLEKPFMRRFWIHC